MHVQYQCYILMHVELSCDLFMQVKCSYIFPYCFHVICVHDCYNVLFSTYIHDCVKHILYHFPLVSNQSSRPLWRCHSFARVRRQCKSPPPRRRFATSPRMHFTKSPPCPFPAFPRSRSRLPKCQGRNATSSRRRSSACVSMWPRG